MDATRWCIVHDLYAIIAHFGTQSLIVTRVPFQPNYFYWHGHFCPLLCTQLPIWEPFQPNLARSTTWLKWFCAIFGTICCEPKVGENGFVPQSTAKSGCMKGNNLACT